MNVKSFRRHVLAPLVSVCMTALALSATGPTLAEESKTPGGDAQAVEQVMRAYEDAWSRHDARAVAGFYHEPALRVSPAGPTVRETRAVQEAFFSGFLPKLVQQGYATSTWEQLQVRLLDANTAIASGVVVRRRGDGSEFQRQGVTYQDAQKRPDAFGH